MQRFIPKKKLSKKARRELDRQYRALWPCDPVTRRTADPRAYDRNKVRRQTRRLTDSELCSSHMAKHERR